MISLYDSYGTMYPGHPHSNRYPAAVPAQNAYFGYGYHHQPQGASQYMQPVGMPDFNGNQMFPVSHQYAGSTIENDSGQHQPWPAPVYQYSHIPPSSCSRSAGMGGLYEEWTHSPSSLSQGGGGGGAAAGGGGGTAAAAAAAAAAASVSLNSQPNSAGIPSPSGFAGFKYHISGLPSLVPCTLAAGSSGGAEYAPIPHQELDAASSSSANKSPDPRMRIAGDGGIPTNSVSPHGGIPSRNPPQVTSNRPQQNRSPFEWIKKPSYQNQQSSGKTRTKDKYRVVYSDHQRLELEKEFRYTRYITIRRKTELATLLGLTERQIKIWFQNRRAKERKQAKKRDELAPKDKADSNSVPGATIPMQQLDGAMHLPSSHPGRISGIKMEPNLICLSSE